MHRACLGHPLKGYFGWLEQATRSLIVPEGRMHKRRFHNRQFENVCAHQRTGSMTLFTLSHCIEIRVCYQEHSALWHIGINLLFILIRNKGIVNCFLFEC